MLTKRQHGLKVQNTFVTGNNTASIRCPECNTVKITPVSKFRNIAHTLKTRCGCGCIFIVSLDFRRHYRKPTKLAGFYTLNSAGSNGGGRMQLFNISRSGVGFTVSGIHNISEGQRARITFTLDNKKETQIAKDVIVKSIRKKNIIGCEFEDKGQLGKDLGFYLHP